MQSGSGCIRAVVCAVTAVIVVHPAFAQEPHAAAAFWKRVQAACDRTAARPASELGQRIARIARDEFTQFGGHRIDADGELFRFGLTEAEHLKEDEGERAAARLGDLGWWRVMKYWRSLYGKDAADKLEVRGYRNASTATDEDQAASRVRTSASELLRAIADVPDPATRETLREAILRAAAVDTSWSAAFISYVIRQAGVTADAFQFANAHRVFIYDAFATSADELTDKPDNRLYRACPLFATRPRVGDLLCQQREPALTDATDSVVRERIRAELGGSGPHTVRRTHCEVVAYVDAPARKLYTIGGNVNQAVSARKLNLRRDFKFSAVQGDCAGPRHWRLPQSSSKTSPVSSPRDQCSLNDRNWFVLLQLR
jgi:hypothetical protein